MSFLDELAADIGNVFIDDFSQPVFLVAQAATIQGIFDDPSQTHELKPGARQALAPVHVDFDGPMLLVSYADVLTHGVVTGNTLNIAGSLFDVCKPPQKSGDGLAVLLLDESNSNDTSGSWRL